MQGVHNWFRGTLGCFLPRKIFLCNFRHSLALFEITFKYWPSNLGQNDLKWPKNEPKSMYFQDFFLQNMRFLSDQEVPGRHKNIYRELRPSFTRSEIFGNMCCLFRQQTQHLLLSWFPGSPKGALWDFVRKVILSFFDLKNRFEVFHRPTNIARGRFDILFHFSNDWYKISKVGRKNQNWIFDFTKNTLKWLKLPF